MTKRSFFLAIALCLACASVVWALRSEAMLTVGILLVASGPTEGPAQGVSNGLQRLGYVDGKNIKIEIRSAKGQADRLAILAQELVALKVDVIVTGTEPAARAVQQATGTIPIVVVLSDHDPVASGLVNSLSRSESNITGVVTRQSELVGKRLELLKQSLPRLTFGGILGYL